MSNAAVVNEVKKPAKSHTDDEVRQSPGFVNLRAVLADLDESEILRLAREVLEAQWVQVRDSRRKELEADFVRNMRMCDPELKNTRITVSVGEGEDDFTVEYKRERQPRWTEETYAQHLGEFTKEYRSEGNAAISGEYKLTISKGRNEDEKVFMQLQEPSGRILAFPPRNPEAPVNTAELLEVTSISGLLRNSAHKTTLSVWQYFGLKGKPQDEPEGGEQE